MTHRANIVIESAGSPGSLSGSRLDADLGGFATAVLWRAL